MFKVQLTTEKGVLNQRTSKVLSKRKDFLFLFIKETEKKILIPNAAQVHDAISLLINYFFIQL